MSLVLPETHYAFIQELDTWVFVRIQRTRMLVMAQLTLLLMRAQMAAKHRINDDRDNR